MKTVFAMLAASALTMASLSANSTLASTATYQPSSEDFPNPERGFLDSQRDNPGSISRTVRDKNETLMRMYYVISSYRNQPLPQSVLNQIETDLTKARASGLKIIPRFAYNFGMDPDASKDQIFAHIDQVAPILRRNSDVIAFLEAGFVGAWGEWHDSTSNLLDNGAINAASRAIADKLLAVMPTNRMVAMRYPSHKRALTGLDALTASEAFTGTNKARLGAHNDCLLAGYDDTGTYDYRNPEPEKVFYNQDNLYVPQGGETCPGGSAEQISCGNSIKEMARMRFTTISELWVPAFTDSWTNGGCYGEIKQRLGYRFRLTETQLPDQAASGSNIAIKLSVANDGFAAPYNPRGLAVVLRSLANGSTRSITITDGAGVPQNKSLDPRFWTPGVTTKVDATLALPADLAAGKYEVLLNLYDPEPNLRSRADYAIRLANQNVWEGNTGLNKLGHTLEVTNGGVVIPPGNCPVQNGGFEAGSLTAWAPYSGYERSGDLAVVSAPVESGNAAAKLGRSGGGIKQTFCVKPNNTYTLTGWVNAGPSNENICLVVSDYGGPEKYECATANAFSKLSLDFTSGSASTATVSYWKRAGNGDAFVDETSVTEGRPN